MEAMMSCNNVYVNDHEEWQARRAVSRMVEWYRQRGRKNEHALELAATALGITPRRAWALRYPSQLVKLTRAQYALILHREWAYQDQKAAELRAEADRVERQAEAERIAAAQLTLPLGEDSPCYAPSSHASVSGGGTGTRIEAKWCAPLSGGRAGNGCG